MPSPEAQLWIDALHKGRKIAPYHYFSGIHGPTSKHTCALGAIALGLGIKLDDNYTQAYAAGLPVSKIYSIYDDWEWRERGSVDTGFENPDNAVIAYLQTL